MKGGDPNEGSEQKDDWKRSGALEITENSSRNDPCNEMPQVKELKELRLVLQVCNTKKCGQAIRLMSCLPVLFYT
jgi:hypothetical protein